MLHLSSETYNNEQVSKILKNGLFW